MQSVLYLLLLLQGALLVGAWLPSDRNLFARQDIGNHATSNEKRHHSTQVRRSPSFMQRRLIAQQKIRGVNIGSLFVMEPWMAPLEWSNMGCGDYPAESECVKGLGQDAANDAFRRHWDTWITEEDLKEMVSYGLNTVRVPIGFWMNEQLVRPDERYPQGGLGYLERLCGWAASMQMYVILDLHGMPGAQQANASFTGTYVPEAGFYDGSEYSRAFDFLAWMTELVHSSSNFSAVGMIEVVNEPDPGHSSLLDNYYPGAVQAIRSQEKKMGISPTATNPKTNNTSKQPLTAQVMDWRWGAGNARPPLSKLNDTSNLAYDNHHYLFSKVDVAPTRAAYINSSCSTVNETDNDPLVYGEWSLATPDDDGSGSSDQFGILSPGATQFYQQWWAAQVTSYERHLGWIFWSWKTDLLDYRWDYRKAVAAGVIPTDPTRAYELSPCRR